MHAAELSTWACRGQALSRDGATGSWLMTAPGGSIDRGFADILDADRRLTFIITSRQVISALQMPFSNTMSGACVVQKAGE